MTRIARWRLAHSLAAVAGALLMALTVRQALVFNGPDLRTAALAMSGMAGMMVGLILLMQYLTARRWPILYLAAGFLSAGALQEIHGIASSMALRSVAPGLTELSERSGTIAAGLLSFSFLASWAAWRWAKTLDRLHLSGSRQLAVLPVIVIVVLGVGFVLEPLRLFTEGDDLLWIGLFAIGLAGYGLKTSQGGDTFEYWLILAGIFLVDGQVATGLFGHGRNPSQVSAGELMTLTGYVAAFVGSVLSAYELFARAEQATRVARARNEELQKEVALRTRAEEESRQLALVDPLTGLYNRRGFLTVAAHVQEVARRQRQAIHLLLFDLDHFKQVNDRFGHTVGDQALLEFGRILKGTFRKSDLVARTGGDEFCVLFMEPDEGIESALLRLQRHVDDSNQAGTRSYRLAFSVGHGRAIPDGDYSVHALVEMADEAMYEQKRRREQAA